MVRIQDPKERQIRRRKKSMCMLSVEVDPAEKPEIRQDSTSKGVRHDRERKETETDREENRADQGGTCQDRTDAAFGH